jgi:hypothetical protein
MDMEKLTDQELSKAIRDCVRELTKFTSEAHRRDMDVVIATNSGRHGDLIYDPSLAIKGGMVMISRTKVETEHF